MHKRVSGLLFLLLVILLAISVLQRTRSTVLTWDTVSVERQQITENPEKLFQQGFIFEQGMTPRVHAPTIVVLPGGELLTVWYGGSREGSADVGLYAARKSPAAGNWSQPEKIMDRQTLSNDLGVHIRKLGNAVLLADKSGGVWMFFVSTSVGGWSTSTINLVISQDGGRSWSKARRLWTSPFLNLSTLVKGRPFFYVDGSIGLPAYHELLGKFAELLRVSPDGQVLYKVRLTHGRHSIQPAMQALTDRHMLAMLRNTSAARTILRLRSDSGGQFWMQEEDSGLPNPDAAVTLSGTADRLVLVYNDTKDDRNRLALALSRDGGMTWDHHYQLEDTATIAGEDKAEYSYPYLVRTNTGDYHLVYTWKRTHIAYVHFNEAWLEHEL